jgi:hypothetical protein
MSRTLPGLLLCLCVILSACASPKIRKPEPPVTEQGQLNEVEPVVQKASILDYRGRNAGASVPRWLQAYLDGGIPGVEAMSEYQDVYAFVRENEGSLTNMEQWLKHFDVKRAFPRASADRLRYRFIRNLTARADDVYGRNYEAVVKAAFNTSFSDVWKESDFWIIERTGNASLQYRYFILMLIRREVYEETVREMLWKVSGEGSTREQTAAFFRVRDTFFEGF